MAETYRYVRSNYGNAAWLMEFKPTKNNHINLCILLLTEIVRHRICSAIVGTFPAYLAKIFRSFDRLEFAIAASPHMALYEILQR
jgi:hypothetical protein